MRFALLFLVLAGCTPGEWCRSIQPGTPVGELPLHDLGVGGGHRAAFETFFSPTNLQGPPEYRCCAARAQGATFAGCKASLDCTAYEAKLVWVDAPYSGDNGDGRSVFDCAAAVKDGVVVAAWGRANE